jgi:hypothetical protein
MLPIIVDVRYAGGHRVWLRFADDVSGEIDLAAELWGPVFEPLRAIETFAMVRLDPDTDTIAWPNGADFSPSWLHERLLALRRKAAAAE